MKSENYGVRAVGYVRISTNENKQKYGLEIQRQGIRRWCGEKGLELGRLYKDTRSGRTLSRPGIQELLQNKDSFDVVVIYKIDRLSRSMLDLLRLTREELRGKSVVFVTEHIDQTTKEGRLFFNQLAAFAEYERDLIVERIKDGLAEAKRNGVRLGAKPKYLEVRKEVIQMREEQKTWKEICEVLNIDFKTAKKCIEV